ncbi:MAG: hypothetical protein KC421_11625 [Anaerolineales bacterium]|nr:hypothetical protein [Anaerolineales bacterium]
MRFLKGAGRRDSDDGGETAVLFRASRINATYEFPGGGIVFILDVVGHTPCSKATAQLAPSSSTPVTI